MHHNDNHADPMLFGYTLALVGALGFGIVYGLWSLFKPAPPPPTAEQACVLKYQSRCDAMRGGMSYNDGLAECWRTPLMRHPKKMFEEKCP